MAHATEAAALDQLDQVGEGSTLNPKWFHPLVAGLWLGCLGVIAPATGLSPWWWAAAGPVLTVVARAAVTMWVAPGTYGESHYDRVRAFTLAAGFAATAWLLYAGLTDKAGRAVGALALWTVVFGSMYAVLRHRAPLVAEKIHAADTARAQEIAAAELTVHSRTVWGPWFAQCGVPVEVASVEETLAGYTLHLTPGVNDKGNVVEFSALRSALRRLAVLAAKHYRRAGVTIGTDQLRAEETEAADEWLLHVDTKQPLKGVIDYPGDTGAGSILEPATLGIYQDGTPITVHLCGVHGLMVGTTGSGKSVCLNCMIAAVTRCPDAELWIATTSKLMPVVWPWLEPWLTGRTSRPVIDRIAGENLDEVLLMLADAYKAAKLQNRRNTRKSKRHPTIDDPAIFIVLDEATDVAKNKTATVTTFDGREWTASALFDALCAMARSAGISLWFMTQYGLVDALGDHGSETLRNITVRIAGKTQKAYDGTATLSGMDHVDTTKLRDNKLLIQPNQEVPRVIPGKTFLLDDVDQIAAVAIAHTRYRSNGLPAWLAAELGGSYTERWLPFRQPTLVEACEMEGIAYPIPMPRDGDNPTATPAEPPAQTLPAQEPTGTLSQVTATTTLSHLTTARDQLMARIAESKGTAGLGRVFVSILQAFRAEDAPAYAALDQIVLAAELATPESGDEAFSAAFAEAARHLTHFGVKPVERTDPDHAAAPVSDLPVYRRRDIIATYERIKAATLTRDNTTPPPAVDEVVAALAGMPDDAWIRVGQLGRMVGAITDGEDPRAAASRFSDLLRTRYDLDPDTAFRRRNDGSHVSVAAIRAGAGRAQVAA